MEQKPPTAAQRQSSGEWIRNARKAKGMTQPDLARAIGVVTASISAYEVGRSGVDEKRIPLLARALGKSVTETRRALGKYVPDDAPEETLPEPMSVLAAILADPDLRPDFKHHISNQYKILREATLATRHGQTDAEALGRELEHAEEVESGLTQLNRDDNHGAR